MLTTTKREPILRLDRDDSEGVHDTLIAACDEFRYRELTAAENGGVVPEGYWHKSCADNVVDGLVRDLGLNVDGAGGWDEKEKLLGIAAVPLGWTTPQPLNLWMNIPVHPKKASSAGPAASSERKEEEEGVCCPASVSPSAGADLSFERPVSKKGSSVTMRALRGCVVVMSACPQDMLEINCREPRECEFMIGEA